MSELNRIGFKAVQPGMTQSEVESLVGGPPGSYGGMDIEGMTIRGVGEQSNGDTLEVWHDEEVWFEVHFDREGRVTDKYLRTGYSPVPMYAPE